MGCCAQWENVEMNISNHLLNERFVALHFLAPLSRICAIHGIMLMLQISPKFLSWCACIVGDVVVILKQILWFMVTCHLLQNIITVSSSCLMTDYMPNTRMVLSNFDCIMDDLCFLSHPLDAILI